MKGLELGRRYAAIQGVLQDLGNVEVSNKEVRVGRVQDHDAHIVVLRQQVRQLHHFQEHRSVEEVDLAVVDRHPGDALGNRHTHALEVAVIHEGLLF